MHVRLLHRHHAVEAFPIDTGYMAVSLPDHPLDPCGFGPTPFAAIRDYLYRNADAMAAQILDHEHCHACGAPHSAVTRIALLPGTRAASLICQCGEGFPIRY